MISLYILEDVLLLDMSSANIFSPSLAYLFLLLTVSFAKQKFFILMKSSLSINSFMDFACGVFV